ncbi:MAG: 5-formyltetrahydrofolate cyclo-ligase [Saprospiraceae bacterium]|nr:5-formyltetrahydrofolate cyclo-ligase [Saprospiraceae bacterium]MCB9323181.1 5-formyltetrahydrofolate cyclo-ligase [Lewinellaceae bacterium]
MTITDQKKKLRKQMLLQRAKLDQQKKTKYDHWVCQSLWETIEDKGVKNIHCYLPMGTEINISPLIEKMLKEKITVITPKTLPKRKLQNLVLNSLDDLEKGVFGTCHPARSEEYLGQYDLIIVPGLAFDHSNFRLGYGGGYYDNFLGQHTKACKIGICYPYQKMEWIPLEEHDVRLDEVLWDK